MATYLADTHAFLWYLTDDKRLSGAANTVFEETELGNHLIIIPTIVLVECVDIIEKKRVAFDFDLVLEAIEDNANYLIWGLDLEVVNHRK